MMEKKYILGLDLHGTLLEPGEILWPDRIPALTAGLHRLANRAVLYLCTGNDLEFVDRKIPAELRDCFHGYVLETGCSFSPDRFQEKILCRPEEQALIKDLELELKRERFPQVNFFAHRLTTISMFCDQPQAFAPAVQAAVERLRVAKRVLVTYSSVAVDVLPQGYNKFTGLKRVAEGRKTIGIADSMNDAALLLEADFAFAPANLAPELKPLLAAKGRPAAPLAQTFGVTSSTLPLSSKRETEGVLEILAFLHEHLS